MQYLKVSLAFNLALSISNYVLGPQEPIISKTTNKHCIENNYYTPQGMVTRPIHLNLVREHLKQEHK